MNNKDKEIINNILLEVGGLTSATGGRPINKLSNTLEPDSDYSRLDEPLTHTQEPQSNNICTKQMFGFEPSSWQKDICQKVANITDLFINVPPSAGKTKPIICGWQSRCLIEASRRPQYLGNIKDIPKIVWITPTTQLATQIYYNDLIPAILDIFKLSRPLFTRLSGAQIDVSDPNNLIDFIRSEAVSLRCGTGKKGPDRPIIGAVCTYEYAKSLVKDLKPMYLIVDELQEFAPQRSKLSISKYVDYKQIQDKAITLEESIKNLSTSASLIFLTGTINSLAALQIKKFIKNNFNRNLIMIEPITDVENRATMMVQPLRSFDDTNSILNISKNIIKNKIRGNAIVIFSVGNISDEKKVKKQIRPISQKLVNDLPARSIDDVVYTRSNYGTKISKGGNFVVKNIEELKNRMQNPEVMKKKMERMLHEPDEDQLLIQCILRGFGYVVGGGGLKERISNFNEQKFAESILLVQNLFAMGKIYLIFCTNAIGVGANFKIKNLYIPSLQKFSGFAYEPLDDSTLVQLINRVGRSSDIAGTIFCDDNDFSRISQSMFEDPRSWVSPNIVDISQNLPRIAAKATTPYKSAWTKILNFLNF